MKEDKTKFINKLKNETEDNQKFACSCGYYSCDRAFLMGFYNYTSTNDWWEKINYYWEKWLFFVIIIKALIHKKGNKSTPSISVKFAKMHCCQIRYISENKTTCTLPSIPPFNNNNNNNNNKVGVTVVPYRLLELRHNKTAREVSPGGTSVPKQQKFHTDGVNQCLHN